MQFHKVSVESFHCLSTCVEVSRSTRIFAKFTIGMIGNETGLLFKSVYLSRNQSTKVKPRRYCCFFAENFVRKF